MEKKGDNDNHQLVIAIGIFVTILLIGVAAKVFLSKSSTDTPSQNAAAAENSMDAQAPSLDDTTPFEMKSEEVPENNTQAPPKDEHVKLPEETSVYPQEEARSPDPAVAEDENRSQETDQQRFLSNEYILPYSDSQYYTEEDLNQLTQEQLRLARNEIYARKGRKFLDKGLQDYFNGCSWYKGTIEPDSFEDGFLNAYENANKDLISQYEQKKGYR